jgi:dTMP kinase
MFITFEGIDYCGKSTQFQRALAELRKRGHECLDVREPGGTLLSEQIRSILLDNKHSSMVPESEMFLFSAARAQLVREVIAPSLSAGRIVMADRFHDSTTAYQGFGRGIPLDTIFAVHKLATAGIEPDLTLLFDISVDESWTRRAMRASRPDRMETSDRLFFERVRDGYLTLAGRFPGRFMVIDGARAIDTVSEDVMKAINGILERHK